jgi:hypothetical protein
MNAISGISTQPPWTRLRIDAVADWKRWNPPARSAGVEFGAAFAAIYG